MAGGSCGYPVFGGLLMNECFTLAGNQVKLKGMFEKTNCLKFHKQNENNDMF